MEIRVLVGLILEFMEAGGSGMSPAFQMCRTISMDRFRRCTSPYFKLNTQAYASNTGKPGAYEVGSVASKKFIVEAHARAFPKTQLVMMTDDGDGLCAALRLDPKHISAYGETAWGLGENGWSWQFPDHIPNCSSENERTQILNRWKTAPFVTEPFGNGSSPTFPCETSLPIRRRWSLSLRRFRNFTSPL